MPLVVRCSACQSPLRVPDHVIERGAKMRCPKCKAPIEKVGSAKTTRAAPTPAPPVGRLEPTPKPPAPRTQQGFPEGILDQSIVVPLGRSERVPASGPAPSVPKSDDLRVAARAHTVK